MTAGKGSAMRPRVISQAEWDRRHAATFPGYWRVERQRPDGTWRQLGGEGMGSLSFNRELFRQTAAGMKRGTIRLVNDRGEVADEFTAGGPDA